jgi:hypothetical protein
MKSFLLLIAPWLPFLLGYGTSLAAAATVRIPAGTILRVRLAQPLDTSRNGAGSRFEATLVSPLAEHGKVILPGRTRFTGHVVSAKPSGRLKGRGYITVALDSFELRGARHRISTSTATRVTGSHKKRNIALIGGGSGVGALIGGLAGGGKGALIGAGAGAAAGTGGAAATGKKNVHIPAETVLAFRLRAPVELTGM